MYDWMKSRMQLTLERLTVLGPRNRNRNTDKLTMPLSFLFIDKQTQILTSSSTWAQTRAHTLIHTLTATHTHTHMRILSLSHYHTHAHTCTHRHTSHTYSRTFSRTFKHRHTDTQTHRHTDTNTFIHTLSLLHTHHTNTKKEWRKKMLIEGWIWSKYE